MAELAPLWTVGVADVAALTPHVTVYADDAPAPVADPDYSLPGIRRIRNADVERWIGAISARVSGRLWRLPQLPETHPARPGILSAAADVVANGAASYLVDAAFPAKAAPNENTSYGAVLKARYEEGIVDLEARLLLVLEEIAAGGDLGGPAALSFEFPAPMFGDRIMW